jgi:hypothetical protein
MCSFVFFVFLCTRLRNLHANICASGPANGDHSGQPHDRHAGNDSTARPATRSHNTASTSKASPVAANGPQKPNISPSVGGVTAQFEPRSPIDPLSHVSLVLI